MALDDATRCTMALDDATGIAIFSSVGGLIALLVIGGLIWKCKKDQAAKRARAARAQAQPQQQAVQMQTVAVAQPIAVAQPVTNSDPQTSQPMAMAVAEGKV